MKNILLKIVVFLCCLEMMLRLGGFAAQFTMDRQNHAGRGSAQEYRIMCVGESITYEGGDTSYPHQLENILQDQDNTRHYKVINKGIPGGDSPTIVSHINAWLDEYHPQMVVIMMGINDRAALVAADPNAWSSRFLNFCLDLRVVKLIKGLGRHIAHDVQAKFTPAVPVKKAVAGSGGEINPEQLAHLPKEYAQLYMTAISYEAKKQYEKAGMLYMYLTTWPVEAEYAETIEHKLGDAFRHQAKYPEFAGVVRHVLQQNPADGWVAQWVPTMCHARTGDDLLEGVIFQMLKENPQTPNFYDLLGACYAARGQMEQADLILAGGKRLRVNKINPVTRENYRHLVRILDEHQVKMVFVQYPLREMNALTSILADVPEAHDGIFVDNQPVFEAALKMGKYDDYFKDRFAGDFGHGTTLGNYIMAQNIAHGILESLKKQ